jgi:hypothetical protein
VVVLLLVAASIVGGDIPRCDGHNPEFTHSPFCLPNDYNKDIVPATEGPLHINVDIWVFEVSRIDDIQLSMTFELYFDLTWNESRLVINETSPDWGPDGSFMGSTNFIKSLWLPDIQVRVQFKCFTCLIDLKPLTKLLDEYSFRYLKTTF